MGLFDGWGHDYNLNFLNRATLSGGNGRALIRNTGSLVLAIRNLVLTSPIGGTFTAQAGSQTGAATTAPIGTSAGLVTARAANVATNSMAFPARAYYGTSGATTGITASAGYALMTRYLEAAGSVAFATPDNPICIWPSGVLAIVATPSSQQNVGVFAQVRALPKSIAAD